jgi:hypothetical protein
MAHLRSCGKGANKTPPDCVASDLPQVGRDGPFVVRWTFSGAVHGTEGVTGKTEEGVTGGHNLRSAAFAARRFIFWDGCRRARRLAPPQFPATSAIPAGMKSKLAKHKVRS